MNAAMEGFNKNANRVMNSLVPVGSNANSKGSSGLIFTLIIIAVVVIVCVGFLYYFKDSLNDLTMATMDTINGYFSTPPKHSPPPIDVSGSTATGPAPGSSSGSGPAPGSSSGSGPAPGSADTLMPDITMKNVEKILSGASTGVGGNQVFNVSSNKYTYYDAEPLCKALGAELATYDQVKDAWSKGADWCNYGWIKGQMAVYPTSDDSFNKLQKGPAEQHLACGRPGVAILKIPSSDTALIAMAQNLQNKTTTLWVLSQRLRQARTPWSLTKKWRNISLTPIQLVSCRSIRISGKATAIL